MNRAKRKILEKLFVADMNAIPIYQGRSKYLLELESEGMAERAERILGGMFAVKIKGWRITIKGHVEYCRWAASQLDISKTSGQRLRE